ncbi:sulfite exporter TauE/SafE family protein [Sphingobacterium chuzhouense]|uniref:Sulfite exporter TauE/SafE family protein n=1 Tax=Sphingobacterium chuzhouense TaxID=1742264 RepID=A0ABR7XVQ9_9SPHI|nr:sulfite exporter TauE/SafE family protein [Sphingobacterium chuzhouense]MBD1423104.1 sulfite exporter TauE/SafE family protein [Sphingobacterium chuzhouense]
MTYHYLAFFMGLFGSIHCAVMCGPLLIAINSQMGLSWKVVFNRMLYQAGRILTYGIMGLFLGMLGSVATVQGWQKGLSITVGIILLTIGMFYLFGKNTQALTRFQTKAVQPFTKYMGQWLYRPGGSFVAGTLNGILPCGMVYMALASAMNADSLANSFLFMVLFGLGTLPLLFIFSFAGSFSKPIFKRGFNRVLPFLYLIMGVWFILRGANLDIPYLSPLLHVDGAINCA